ncbi:MAG: molybdenum cofactor guanylyltransferase [Clostridium sp.]|uniref:molybdenum cofactor guanylyltransferase n=1 Tax=Clostridium sp. TaxID=1506 RepID=UPI003F3478F5
MIECIAVILAGGESSRMNYSPKALLKYEDKLFIDREIEALKDFKEILVSCNDEKIKEKIQGYKIIEDKIKNIGPIGGLYSVLSEVDDEKVLVVSCDMPFLKKEILNKLGSIDFKEECLIPTVNGKIEPFCGVYKKEILGKIKKSIEEEKYGLIRFIKGLNVKFIEINDENNFININTVEEYDKLVIGE